METMYPAATWVYVRAQHGASGNLPFPLFNQLRRWAMLWILSSMLLVLWIVGLIREPLGGFIHVLLVLALIGAGTELALRWRRHHYGS